MKTLNREFNFKTLIILFCIIITIYNLVRYSKLNDENTGGIGIVTQTVLASPRTKPHNGVFYQMSESITGKENGTKFTALTAMSLISNLDSISERRTAISEISKWVNGLDCDEIEKILSDFELVELGDKFEEDKDLILNTLLKRIAEESPERVLQIIAERKLSDNHLAAVMPQVITSLWNSNQSAAENFLNALPMGILYNIAYSSIVSEMAKVDYVRAVRFSLDFPDGGEFKDRMLSQAVNSVVDSDVEYAMELFQIRQDPIEKEMLAISIAKALSEEGSAEVLNFAKSLDGNSKLAALGYAAQVWANSDPKGLSTVLEKMPLGSERNIMLETLLSNWSNWDADSAASSHENFFHFGSDSQYNRELSNVAVNSGVKILTELIKDEPKKGLDWINNMESSEVKDYIMYSALINDLFPSNQDSFSFAVDLVDAKKRNEQVSSIIEKVISVDIQQAHKMIKESRLANSEKILLLDRIKN